MSEVNNSVARLYFGRNQAYVSDLVRSKLGRFSMERLERFLNVLDAAGQLCNLSPVAANRANNGTVPGTA